MPPQTQIQDFNHTKQSNVSKNGGFPLKGSYADNLPIITWQELAKHCTPDDMWMSIHGKVYNVTDWQHKHPGGAEMIRLMAGREATNLFEAYHKLSTWDILKSDKIPLVAQLESSEFPMYTGESEFFKTLKKRAENKLYKELGIKNMRAFSPKVIANTIFIFGGLILSYYLSMYCSSVNFLTCMFFAFAAGFFHYLSMVHLYHDMSHCAYTSNAGIWEHCGNTSDLLIGLSCEIWRHRHIVGHHVYTNVSGVDPDIATYKCSPKAPLVKYKSKTTISPSWFQPYLYVIVLIHMQLDDIFSMLRGSMENIRINPRSLYQVVYFWFGKLFFITHRVILPIYLGYHSIIGTLFLFMISEVVAGVLFGYFSQITHVSEELEWPADRPIPRDWAELQVLTSRDYSQDSYFWTYVSGFLNYQVLHHLFPSISPHLYHHLLPLLKETCKEYDIKYYGDGTFWEAIKQHLNHLKQFQPRRQARFQEIREGKIDKSKLSILDRLDLYLNDKFKSD